MGFVVSVVLTERTGSIYPMSEPKTSEILAAIADLRWHMDHKFELIAERLNGIDKRMDGLDKRMDDQSRMLAALIPTRLAAVPAGAEERRAL